MNKVSILICLSAALAQSIFAELITIQASGYLQTVETPLSGTFSAGDNFTFTYAYETLSVDADPNWMYGDYRDCLSAGTLTIEDYNLTFSTGDIRISTGAETDGYSVAIKYGDSLAGNPIGGKIPSNIYMELDDIDGLVFPNDDLPITAPNLSLFENKLITIMYGDEVTSSVTFGASRAYGKVTSITAIPEPSVLALVGIFGGGLWVVRRFFTL